jgi:hypothetical protein
MPYFASSAQRLGQADQRKFPGAVRREMRDADAPSDGRRVQDSSASAPQVRERRANHVQRSSEMRAQRFFEILDVRILEGGDLDNAGVVDENVEAPAALKDCRDAPATSFASRTSQCRPSTWRDSARTTAI